MVRLLFSMTALAMLAGCGDKGGQDAKISAAQAGQESALTVSAANSSDLTVSILPLEPTVFDTLQAVVRGGTGRPSFHWEINGKPVESRKGDRLAAGAAVKGEEVRVRVHSAENGETATGAAVIRNAPPRINSVSFVDPAVHRGVDIEMIPYAEDPDGDPIRFDYGWFVNGEKLDFADGPVLSGDSFRRGDRLLVQVVPFDGEDYGPTFHAAELVIPNAPPLFVSDPAPVFQENGYRYQAEAVDPDDDRLIYYLENGPEGMTINAQSGLLLWGIADVTAGEHLVRLGVHDPEGMSARQEFTMNISLP